MRAWVLAGLTTVALATAAGPAQAHHVSGGLSIEGGDTLALALEEGTATASVQVRNNAKDAVVPTFIAFLRAINLGKTRKVPMADLRTWLTEAGMADVETYIQTGNVRLTTTLRSRTKVEAQVERVLAERCGFAVPTIVLSPTELSEVYDAAAAVEPSVPGARRYVTFLKQQPPPDLAAEIDGWDDAGERAKVVGRAVHWTVPGPTQTARLSNTRIEKRLGIATTRDLKVVRTLAERWGG
jgi:uncharacterized protein (DUF1697 family)